MKSRGRMVLQERIEVSILPHNPLILLVSRSCAAFYLHYLYAPASTGGSSAIYGGEE